MRARLGQYQLVEEIGRGGMGVVYRAVHDIMGRTVAIKTILFEGSGAPALELRQRLVREAKAAGALQHPNIVTVYDIGVEDDIAYIVMEYVEGGSLEDRLDAGPLVVDETLRILREVAGALDYAHGKGVVHRDIKPGNVLLDREGHIKLVDFGIAKVAGSRTITQTGGWVGTPEHMAPEALRGEPLSGASDQFSLAVLAYEMLTGVSPFDTETTAAVITAVLMTEPAAPSAVRTGLPSQIDAALSRGLAKDAAKRYPGCVAFCDALAQALRPAPEPASVGQRPPVSQTAHLSRTSTAEGTEKAVVLVVLLFVAVAAWLGLRSPASEQRSQQTAVGVGPEDYVTIPPGTFTMGCSAGDLECFDDERPPREVAISRAFRIGRTEVTQESYERVAGKNPSRFKGPKRPVENVSWSEARTYCEEVGMRLPTEQEWEYAARGGTTGAVYGDRDQVAWFVANSLGTTHDVGSKEPNAYGLHDTLGNVWEWVNGWHDANQDRSSPALSPEASSPGTRRVVLRGGSWISAPSYVRLSARYGYLPSFRHHNIGFRCAGD